MTLDPSAVGTGTEPYRSTWTSRDAMQYALCIGAGVDELDFTTENTAGMPQQVFPTFAVVVGHGREAPRPGFGSFPVTRALHGAQSLTLHRPLPVEGDVTVRHSVGAMYDKGEHAIVALDTEATDPTDGSLLFTRRASIFVRGGGGWGGERGPSGTRHDPPRREPDHETTCPTSPDQALLYRLTGDRARLHSDPAVAAEAGFARPILHGLCTYGFTGRALVHALCGGVGARLTHLEARFSAPVLPGEALTVRVWVTGAGDAVFTTAVGGRAVLVQGRVRHT